VIYDRVADPALSLHAADILGDDYLKLADEVKGRVILVGTSASGLLDLHATPLNGNIAGVLIHAGVIDQIVKGQYLSRADWVQGLEILIFALAGAALVFVVLRLGPVAGLAVVGTLIVAIIAVAWFAFTERGWQIDATFPVFGAVLVYGTMVYSQFALTEGERKQLRRAFGYYVAPELLTRIEKSADHLRLGGEARQITVMFSDMRNFTSFTEKHTPEETFAMLNTMFGALGDEIVTRSGTIDKFIGDAIMAFWNAPLDVAAHPRLACEAALGMRRRMAELNAREGLGDIRIGIGLSTGDALVGNMGLESRFDYSAIGDTVNVASRVEGESKAVGFDIVASESTRAAVPEFAWLPAGSVQLKGKAERLPIYVLVGDAAVAQSGVFLELCKAHEELIGGRGDLSACAALATEVDPALARFYELVPERTADFVSAA
jgi:adenylate cyclase